MWKLVSRKKKTQIFKDFCFPDLLSNAWLEVSLLNWRGAAAAD